ncbi:MAG TPA: chromate resistance protein ChrB domain-containing protein [Methylomirabilota bacterium]|nr:chromate resistance protein ChrB domain-containing protein [Methylomirabilota bacterium]
MRAWRRLRALGAVPVKSSAYLLPYSPDRYEQFQWLAQEIQKDGGEATLLKVDRIENMKQADVIRLFQEARNADYAALAERYQRLLKGRRARLDEELGRLAREMERLGDIDFFDAPARRDAQRARETVEIRLAAPRERSGERPAPLDLDKLKGRRWATRPRPHVDRIASAWLIKRFIDPAAAFLFAPAEELPADAIPFDMAGVEFGHQGDDCTFETLLRRSGLRDRKLAAIAEIVHEADLRDQKYLRDEARGIDLALRGLLSAVKDDHEVLAYGMTLFDGLYAAIGEKP